VWFLSREGKGFTLTLCKNKEKAVSLQYNLINNNELFTGRQAFWTSLPFIITVKTEEFAP
jgi:hypothetical protein